MEGSKEVAPWEEGGREDECDKGVAFEEHVGVEHAEEEGEDMDEFWYEK